MKSRRIVAAPFIWAIYLYRVTLSPLIGNQCRYHPTCSRYAEDALRHYPLLTALRMSASRIARCHPFAKGGYDPVPPNEPPIDPPGPVHSREH
ncbi:MAG: membrane protein insertion efficiency factor YidD [Planctomycetota bacterium]